MTSLSGGKGPLSFVEACQRGDEFDAAEQASLQPTGHTRLFHHGRRTERVAILFHGITNNPLQWEVFGEELHSRGWNVLIPRLPYHGLTDLLTPLPGRLRASDMVRYTTKALEIADGLGESVAAVGLSAGGVYTAWAAQQYPIQQAIVIAPVFGVNNLPLWITPLAVELVRHLPNQMRWWDEKSKMAHIPPHAYPMYSTRNLAETLYLGGEIRRMAQQFAPCCSQISIINNAADHAIRNDATEIVAREWKRHGANVQTHLFAASYHLPHDVIDVTQPLGKPALVYGTLHEILQSQRTD